MKVSVASHREEIGVHKRAIILDEHINEERKGGK
jgi:hypothetical protein